MLFASLLLSLPLLSETVETVTLQLQWKHQFEFAGFYAAKEKGFYREEGLDVRFIEYENGMNISDEVLEGRADYGLSYPSIIADYLNGKPLLLLANFFKQSPHVLIVQPEIKTPAMLKGKTIMGMPNNIDYMMFYIMLKKFGVEPGDITLRPSSFDYREFMEKKADADTIFKTNELYELDRRGVDYNIFDPTLYGPVYYDLNLFTTQQEYRRHPDRVRRFRRASIRGWEYAMSHQEELVEIILKRYNTMNKSREALLYEARELEQIVLAKVHPIGSVDLDRLQLIADTFAQAGYITKRPQPIDKFYLSNEPGTIVLNAEEQAYLRGRQKIRVCVRPGRMPLEDIVGGSHTGIAADYLQLMQERLNVTFDPVPILTRDSYMAYTPDVPCDLWSFEAITPARQALMDFTAPVVDVSVALLTGKTAPVILDLHAAGTKRIAVRAGSELQELLEKSYPNLHPVPVADLEEAVKLLQTGQVDGMVEVLPVLDKAFESELLQGLKVGAIFDEKLSLGFATRKDDAVLNRIVQQTLDRMSRSEKTAILNTWFDFSPVVIPFDYSLLWRIIGGLSAVALFFLYRQYELRRHNRDLSEAIRREVALSSKKDKMLFQKQKLASMGAMIENIAHQWRQPLAQVNSAVMVIDTRLDETRCLDTEIERKLAEIETLTRHMSDTIDTFREFFDTTKTAERTQLAPLVRKALALVDPVIRSQNIQIVTQLDNTLEYRLIPDEFLQVLITLLYNAVEVFKERGTEPALIHIRLIRQEQTLLLEVCDNGGGMTPEIVDRVFEPYFTTKPKARGRGLGLYLGRMIVVEKMGQEILAENRGAGACFSIILKEPNG